MKQSFLFLLAITLFLFQSQTFALEKRGHLSYKVSLYENDLEIQAFYTLKENESFFAVCDKPGDEFMPMKSVITKKSTVVFPALLWNSKFVCHISVIDTNNKGRIVKSSGSFTVTTPNYYLP